MLPARQANGPLVSGLFSRLKVKITSSAVIFLPLQKVTSSRSLKV